MLTARSGRSIESLVPFVFLMYKVEMKPAVKIKPCEARNCPIWTVSGFLVCAQEIGALAALCYRVISVSCLPLYFYFFIVYVV